MGLISADPKDLSDKLQISADMVQVRNGHFLNGLHNCDTAIIIYGPLDRTVIRLRQGTLIDPRSLAHWGWTKQTKFD